MSDFDLSQPLLIDESLIIEYLQDNPDFFHRHGDLLKNLRLPHQQKGAVSLVELQVQRLRDKVAGLEQEITDLMAVASHNEKIFKVYVDLLPDLLSCETFAELQHRLSLALVGELGLSEVSLRLNSAAFDLSELAADQAIDPEQIETLRVTRLSREDFYFGRLTRGECQNLFEQPDSVGSVALAALGSNAEFGFFIAASRDADHYVAGMDSLLLTQLCNVLNSLLTRLLPEAKA